MRKFLSVIMSAALTIFSIIPISTRAKTESELLDYQDNGEFLGVASAFSVFVEEDFGANGCDCEGRIFAGRNANIGNATSYAVAEADGASVIVANGELSNFDVGNRIFVYGTNGATQLVGENIYQADLISVDEEFQKLREKSLNLSQKNNGEVKINPYWDAEIDFIGTDPNFNIFNLDNNIIDSCNYFFNYEVPEGSYVIINVAGQNLTAYTQLYGMQYAGYRAQHNKDEISKHVLFNFYEAENLTIAGTGTLYGTVLAPFANAGDDMTEGAHNAGGVIAKSYIGGIEFGNCTYDGGEPDEVQIPTENIETTITTSIPTTSTTTTSTELSTTTTKGTTTTERETETSSTTSTSRATISLSTTTTATTNLRTNTTTSTSATSKTTESTTTTTTRTTTSTTSTAGSTERPTSSSTTTTTTKQTTTSATSTTPRATETTTTNRETTTLATTTTETTTTTTGKAEGTTEVNTHPTTLDQATDIQTSTNTQVKEGTTIGRETSTEGASNDQSGTTTDGTTTGTETTTTIGTDRTIYTTTTDETTTVGTIEKSVKTGDSVDAGKIAGTCGLAMIVGLLAVCGKKEE